MRAMGRLAGVGIPVRAGGVRIWWVMREWSAGSLVLRAMGCLVGAGMPVRAGGVRIWWVVREWSAGSSVMRAVGAVGVVVLVGMGLLSGWDGVPTGKGFYEDYCGCGLWWTFGRT